MKKQAPEKKDYKYPDDYKVINAETPVEYPK